MWVVWVGVGWSVEVGVPGWSGWVGEVVSVSVCFVGGVAGGAVGAGGEEVAVGRVPQVVAGWSEGLVVPGGVGLGSVVASA